MRKSIFLLAMICLLAATIFGTTKSLLTTHAATQGFPDQDRVEIDGTYPNATGFEFFYADSTRSYDLGCFNIAASGVTSLNIRTSSSWTNVGIDLKTICGNDAAGNPPGAILKEITYKGPSAENALDTVAIFNIS
jgi:hypothetical protein